MREATISRTPRCRGSSSPTRSSAGRKTVLCDLCSVYSFSLTAAASDWLSEAAAAACPPIRSGLTVNTRPGGGQRQGAAAWRLQLGSVSASPLPFE